MKNKTKAHAVHMENVQISTQETVKSLNGKKKVKNENSIPEVIINISSMMKWSEETRYKRLSNFPLTKHPA